MSLEMYIIKSVYTLFSIYNSYIIIVIVIHMIGDYKLFWLFLTGDVPTFSLTRKVFATKCAWVVVETKHDRWAWDWWFHHV